MKSGAKTVKAYLAGLPADRRRAIAAVRDAINANLPDGYAEGMQYGMIGWFVPHSVYPPGYHCDPAQPVPFVSLASQKNHLALYLFCLYTDPEALERFRAAWTNAGKRLDMGKSCARFKRLEDVPLDVIGREIRRVPVSKFIRAYEAGLAGTGAGRARTAKKKTKKAAKKTQKNKPSALTRSAAVKKNTSKTTTARATKKPESRKKAPRRRAT